MRKILRAGVVVLTLGALTTFAFIAFVHIDDNFHVDHVAGAWLGLIAYANDGTFYPPLYADGIFGGTRYMPLGIAINALAATIVGDALIAGKLVAMGTLCALLGTAFVLARRLGADRLIALGVVGAIIATFTALFAGTTIYGDALAVALQLGAVAVIAGGTGRRAVVVAGILVALAFTAKLSGLWGAATILLWLAVRDRRRVPEFAAAGVVTALGVLGVAELVSDGRFHENLVGLSGAQSIGLRELVLESPEKTWALLRDHAPATVVLLPFAAAAVLANIARRQLTIVDVAFLLAVAVTLAVMSDVGSGFNHLLDVVVLVPLVVAGAWAHIRDGRLSVALAGAVALAIAISLVDVRGAARETAKQLAQGETPPRLRVPAYSAPLAEPVFTEDPTVAVQRGWRPVALDSFMLLRVLREQPERAQELVARFERREFRSVVLIADLDLRDPWWRESHLGLDIARAIDRNYSFARKVMGPVFAYRLYVPRRPTSERGNEAS